MATGRVERVAAGLARFGLVARTVFYLLLAGLVIDLAVNGSGSGQQANANGALSTVAKTGFGTLAIGATAVGFLALGVTRIWGAVRDHDPTVWKRSTTFLQGAFYVVLTWIPLSYAIGNRSTGSEHQNHKTASGLLHLPLGRELTFLVGLVAVGICVNQIRTGIGQDYTDGLAIDASPRWVRSLVCIAGTVGIPARAAVFFPVGIFLMIAAVQGDPRHADGLDKELTALSRHEWGDATLALVALGLLVFATYSALESRYRMVTEGE